MAPQQPWSRIRLTGTKTSATASGQTSAGLLRTMSRQVTTFWGLLTLLAIAASSVHAETRQEGSSTEPLAAAVVASQDHESVASAQATLASEHWVWQPVQQFDVPSVSKPGWARDPIDAFILVRLDAEGLTPAEEVDALIWLRRVTFDLTGLPPTPRAIEKFHADDSPAARAKVVSRLLESPAFGECWAQHWLDLVRFAETKGHEQDSEIPYAWRYRDYVIRAFNDNVPYDQFVREHIAGDLLPKPRIDPTTKNNQSIQGTGFWHLGEATHSPVDIRGEEADRVANQIDVFGKTFLGLTIACARCHDHKFDAITTEDYYALCGFLQSSGYHLANVADPEAVDRARDELVALNQEMGSRIFATYARLMQPRLTRLPDQLRAAASQAQHDLKEKEPAAEKAESPEPENSLAQELVEAKGDPTHPLHTFATAALNVDEKRGAEATTKAIKQALAQTESYQRDQQEHTRKRFSHLEVIATQKEGELNPVAERQPYDPAKHRIVCFSEGPDASNPETWLAAETCFGNGPVDVGTWILTTCRDQPLRRIVQHRSACSSHISPHLTGLFRTRTFEVVGDKLWYRYRGTADVFMAVDSHRTVSGPLHNRVKLKLESPNAYAWIAHQVDDYLGHRVHVEFSPTGDFELCEVRFSSEQPPMPLESQNRFGTALSKEPPKTLHELATATADQFRSALVAVGQQQRDRNMASWVNWLLVHDDLLPVADPNLLATYHEEARLYVDRRQAIESRIPEPILALAMLDGNSENEYIHIRGNHQDLASETTPRRFLSALDGEINIAPGSGRLQLAEHLVNPQNPLTARVFVNRVWQHLFGQGLVMSVDNFGELGIAPTHPELLDYLATEFVESDWNIQQLISRLVLSTTYRMSSSPVAASRQQDPTNRWIHAARVRRLNAEKIRDAILAVAGELNDAQYGPSVHIHITDFMRHNRSSGEGPVDGDRRRSIYVEVRRNAPSHIFTAFDKPTPFTTTGRRFQSNSAAQPLILLNDPFVHQQARSWATHLVNRYEQDEAALTDAYLTALARPPDDAERLRIQQYLNKRLGNHPTQDHRIETWTEICLTLYNVKEFVFLL
jgi:hypothetical protein